MGQELKALFYTVSTEEQKLNCHTNTARLYQSQIKCPDLAAPTESAKLHRNGSLRALALAVNLVDSTASEPGEFTVKLERQKTIYKKYQTKSVSIKPRLKGLMKESSAITENVSGAQAAGALARNLVAMVSGKDWLNVFIIPARLERHLASKIATTANAEMTRRMSLPIPVRWMVAFSVMVILTTAMLKVTVICVVKLAQIITLRKEDLIKK